MQIFYNIFQPSLLSLKIFYHMRSALSKSKPDGNRKKAGRSQGGAHASGSLLYSLDASLWICTAK